MHLPSINACTTGFCRTFAHRRSAAAWLIGALVLSGCASDPIVDRQGVDPLAYERDRNECEAYAAEVNVAGKAAGQAAASAVLGGVIGVIVGNSGTAGDLAGAGAAVGTAEGTRNGLRERRRVVRNCLRNRGYAVLN